MRKKILIFTAIFGLLTNGAYAFRCGTKIVEPGDKTFEVLQKCGEPVLKEVVGYRLNKTKDIEFEIKEWVYGPRGGSYYFLTFHGTTLINVESRKER